MRKRILIEVDEEALRVELEELKARKTEAEKEVSRIEGSIGDKIKVLEDRKWKFEKEWKQVWKDIDAIKKRVNLQICRERYGNAIPSYGTNSYGYGIDTNLHSDVIEAIKQTVGISKLKHSQVEFIARNIVMQRLARSKKYKALIKKREELRASKEDGWSSIEKIRRDANEFKAKSDLFLIKKRITEILTVLANPKKWKRDQEKEKLRVWATSEEGVAEIDKKLRSLRAR